MVAIVIVVITVKRCADRLLLLQKMIGTVPLMQLCLENFELVIAEGSGVPLPSVAERKLGSLERDVHAAQDGGGHQRGSGGTPPALPGTDPQKKYSDVTGMCDSLKVCALSSEEQTMIDRKETAEYAKDSKYLTADGRPMRFRVLPGALDRSEPLLAALDERR